MQLKWLPKREMCKMKKISGTLLLFSDVRRADEKVMTWLYLCTTRTNTLKDKIYHFRLLNVSEGQDTSRSSLWSERLVRTEETS